MKKIKSVKLKNDFRRAFVFFPKGTELEADFVNGTYVIRKGLEYFTEYEIRNCTTDLFEIEYEPDVKSITVKIQYKNTGDSNSTFTAENIANTLWLCTTEIEDLKVTEVKND